MATINYTSCITAALYKKVASSLDMDRLHQFLAGLITDAAYTINQQIFMWKNRFWNFHVKKLSWITHTANITRIIL